MHSGLSGRSGFPSWDMRQYAVRSDGVPADGAAAEGNARRVRRGERGQRGGGAGVLALRHGEHGGPGPGVSLRTMDFRIVRRDAFLQVRAFDCECACAAAARVWSSVRLAKKPARRCSNFPITRSMSPACSSRTSVLQPDNRSIPSWLHSYAPSVTADRRSVKERDLGTNAAGVAVQLSRQRILWSVGPIPRPAGMRQQR